MLLIEVDATFSHSCYLVFSVCVSHLLADVSDQNTLI